MMKLGTKSETLKLIEGKLYYAKVLPQVSFTVNDWEKDSINYWEEKLKRFGDDSVIVRSSALNEDTKESSQAGKYVSIPDIKTEEEFNQAVRDVINSFDDDNRGEDQVFIQPMLKNVIICGVAFTLDPNTLGNYYVINYDRTGSTSAITSGSGIKNELFYAFKDDAVINSCTEKMKKLCLTLKELEKFFQQNNLDIEFAITKEEDIYISGKISLYSRGGGSSRLSRSI